jgi:hypothetical protein
MLEYVRMAFAIMAFDHNEIHVFPFVIFVQMAIYLKIFSV